MSKLSSMLAKPRYLWREIKGNGGLWRSFLTSYRTDELRIGDLVGEDKFGNKYYHNTRYFVGRSRWVQFSDNVGMDYDASQIPPEWHRWLTYMGDETPTSHPPELRKWNVEYKANPTGTKDCYVPYSTVKPKIEPWQPPTPPQ